MANPKDPAASATKERAKRAVDKKEAPKKKPTNIHGLKKQAEKLSSDPNVKAAEAIRKLKGNVETAKQLEGLTYLYQALDKVLIKLAKKDVELEKARTAKDLEHEALKNGIKLSMTERVALETLDRILKEPGETSRAIEKHWDPRLKAAKEASKGIHSKAWEYAKKNRAATALFVVTGIAGIMLGYSAIKKIIKKSSDGKKDSWFSKDIMLPLMVMLAAGATGTALSMSDVKKIFAKRGLDHAKMQAKAKAGKPFTKGEQGKLKKAGKDIKDKVDKARKKEEEATTAAPAPGVSPETTPPSPELLENAEKKRLREFGDKLLTDKGAHKLEGGIYMMITGIEKENWKTYFRFKEDKWQWAGQKQKDTDSWADCPKSKYTNAKMKKINDIAEKLAGGPAKKITEGVEAISEDVRGKLSRYNIVMNTLTGLYCVDGDKYGKIKPQIKTAFDFLKDAKVSDILGAYEKAKAGDKKVALATLGIHKKASTSEEAVFHACAIVHIAFRESKRIGKTPDRDQELEDFFGELGKDPTLEISTKIQDAINSKIQTMKITSFGGLLEAKEEVFDDETINDIFKNNTAKFVDHLAQRYKIDMTDFNKKEKADFSFIIVSLYAEGRAFDQSSVTISKFSRNRGANTKVTQAAEKFVAALKNEVIEEGGLLEKCIERYDIKRGPKNKKYDQVLKRYLKPDILYFKDGFQMALLSDGVRFDQPTNYESVGQAKDITMIYLMVNILKKRSKNKAYPLYVGNVIHLASTTDTNLKINPNFKFLAPYFSKLFGALMKGATTFWGRQKDMIEAMEDMSVNPDKIEKLKKMDFVDFPLAAATTGARGAYQISKDLLLALYGEFPDAFDTHTTAEDVFKMILTLDGAITYPAGAKQVAGAVYLGGKYYFIRPIGILWDTAKAAITTGSPGTTAKTYLISTAPFVVFSATYGALSGIRHATKLEGALRGVGRGLAAPASMPIAGYRALRGAKRISSYSWNALRGRSTANLELSMALFEKYNGLNTSVNTGALYRAKLWKKQFTTEARKLLYRDIYSRMRIRWAKFASVSYNDFWGLTPELEQVGRGEVLEPISYTNKIFFESTDFKKKLQRMETVLDNMRKIKNMERLSETEFFEQLKKTGELTDPELKALKNKAKDMGFKKFRKSLARDLKPPKAGALGRVKDWRRRFSEKSGSARPKAAKLGAEVATPKDLGNGKFKYMGEEISLKKNEIDEMTRRMKGNRTGAIEKLCRKKWSQPHFLSEGPKGRLYRFRGGEFVLNPAEYKRADAKQIAKIIEAKYAESIKITDGRVLKGVPEFKINGQWVKAPKGPGSMAKLKADYVEAAKSAGHGFEYRDLKNTKLLKYFPILKEAAGPAMAVAMIYHLETAKDKRKAIAETAVGFGTFMAGAKGMEKMTRKYTPKSVTGALGKGGLILISGLATAIGVTEPVSSVLNDLIPKFAGDQQISLELVSLFEKHTTRQIAIRGLHKLETAVAKKALEKKGLQTVGKLLGKKIEGTVLKKVAAFASKPLLKKLATSLGVRGVVLAALLLDDATVIGVLDDVVAVGMAVWMAKDIYDVTVLANRAFKIKDAMEEYNKMPIANVEPSTIVDKKAIEAALAIRGKTLETATGDELMEIIKTIPDIRIKITRQGSAGYEEYRFVKGEVFSTKIKTKTGEILELSDEELNQEIAVGPPEEFKTWEIDYSLPKEKLLANYRMAMLYTKSECGWTKLDFDIKDDKTIVVKRLDGSGKVSTIKRTGTTWSVDSFSGGHTLFQALVLANLTNKVHGILSKEDHSGGSEEPFKLDGNSIDFDKTWNPNDLRILEEETGWIDFYGKVGITNKEIVGTLNAWYHTEFDVHAKGGVEPPKEFNPMQLDYSASSEKLQENYKSVIEYTIGQTKWNNLDYTIINDNQIRLARKDGGSITNLHREGNKWRVGNKVASTVQGFSLVQAVAMGNLTNWADQWIKREGIEPGDPNPFEIDGGKIEYDTDDAIFDIDTVFMDRWNSFYSRIGLTKKRSVDVLNHFFGY